MTQIMKYLSKLLLCLACYTYVLTAQNLLDNPIGHLPPNINVQEMAPNKVAQLVEEKHDQTPIQHIHLFKKETQKIRPTKIERFVKDAVFLQIDDLNLHHLYTHKHQNINLQIPVNKKQFIEVELTKVKITTNNYTLQTSRGEVIDLDQNQGVFYRGIVKDNPNSVVAFSVFKDHIRALIADDSGNYVLGKMPKTEQYILYNERKLTTPSSFSCATDDEAILPEPPSAYSKQVTSNPIVDCVEVYIETDHQTFCDLGFDVNNVNNYITALFNEVATLYANEGITVVLSDLYVWVNSDPYMNLPTPSDILSAFAGNLQDNYNGRLAHFVSTRPIGAGIAYRDMLCYDYHTYTDSNGDLKSAGPYAVSTSLTTTINPIPTFSRDVFIFAHEMGHNFGSYHTQTCVWGFTGSEALDNCYCPNNGCAPGPEPPASGGTIMSYCHLPPYDPTDATCPVRPGGANPGINFAAGFGQEPGDLIRSRYNNAICLNSCDPEDYYAYSCFKYNLFTESGPNNVTVINVAGDYEILPIPADDVEICVTTTGDVGNATEIFQILDEDGNFQINTNSTDVDCAEDLTPACFYVSPEAYNTWIGNGTITVVLNPINNNINPNLCHINEACVRVHIPSYNPIVECPPSLYLAGTVESGMHQAAESIYSNGSINGDSVTLEAGDFIELQNNFEVMTGSELNVNMESCMSVDSTSAKPILNILQSNEPNTLYLEYNNLQTTPTEITVKDAFGNTIQTLSNPQMNAKGLGQQALDTSNFKEGIYYIHLQNQDNHVVEKTLIIH